MSSSDLGPKPEPQIEPGEPNPGGVDAVDPDSGPLAIPDLSPAENPSLEEKAPEPLRQEVAEGEDTSTEATRGADGEGDASEREQRSE
jgi:hypothetical protein